MVPRDMPRDLIADFKTLRLHGMAGAWADLVEQHSGEIEGSRWLIEQMLRAETIERATRSVGHQMSAARFPAQNAEISSGISGYVTLSTYSGTRVLPNTSA